MPILPDFTVLVMQGRNDWTCWQSDKFPCCGQDERKFLDTNTLNATIYHQRDKPDSLGALG